MNKKIKCDICKKEFRRKNVIRYKGKFVCISCRKKSYYKKNKKMPIVKSFKELLNKTYFVSPCGDEEHLYGRTYFNRILIGKKFKIKLVEENEE